MIDLALQTKPRVAIETHGCKLNQADSGSLATEFADAGFDVVGEDTPVDVYVVNSCTVTHVADSKARRALRSARRRHPNATIVATGCYAQRSPETLRQLNEVDLVVEIPRRRLSCDTSSTGWETISFPAPPVTTCRRLVQAPPERAP